MQENELLMRTGFFSSFDVMLMLLSSLFACFGTTVFIDVNASKSVRMACIRLKKVIFFLNAITKAKTHYA